MKKIIYLLFACLLLFVSSSMLFSCTEESYESETKTIIKETTTTTSSDTVTITADFTYWFSSEMLWASSKETFLTTNGETIGVDSVILNTEKSTEGLYIKRVKYSFDGKELSTISVAPYNFSYTIKNENVGDHKFSYEVTYSGKDGEDRTANGEYNILIMAESLNVDDALYLGDNTERVTEKTDVVLSKNDVLTGHLELLGSNVSAKITKVEYYYDGKLISASSIEPYSFSYSLPSDSEGKHKFTRLIYINCDYGELTLWRLNEITIK